MVHNLDRSVRGSSGRRSLSRLKTEGAQAKQAGAAWAKRLDFTADDWELLAGALVAAIEMPVEPRRRNLLPQILEEWDRKELREHLLQARLRGTTRERIKKLDKVKRKALQLMEALNELGDHDRGAAIAQIFKSEGRDFADVSRVEWSEWRARLEAETKFLSKLSAIEPGEYWKRGRGHPRNILAYSVMKDAAAIFEWLTGTKATRVVDRDTPAETGPFYRFVSVLWPMALGNGNVGLAAAMKNWALWSAQYNEQSPLIANIDMRHRAWGVFEG